MSWPEKFKSNKSAKRSHRMRGGSGHINAVMDKDDSHTVPDGNIAKIKNVASLVMHKFTGRKK